ncbi:MAG: 4-hydroxy-tetrahydrodipicolinate reductase [Planctomycetota bacterium]|jgi:4-hydroxy-tetrahydrodipicolinate reductase
MKPKLIISGAAGRMGKRIISLSIDAQAFEIIAAIDNKDHPDMGKDAGLLAGSIALNIAFGSTYPPQADVVIDFSLPQAADVTIDYCSENKAALVMGTTGLSKNQQAKIQQVSSKIPVIYGTNMMVGMNVLFALVGKAAAMLGDDVDIEIIEQHHRFKKDSPSGSALTLAENICKETGRDFPACLTYGREGKDALRTKGEIGIHAVRAGDIVGIHSVILSTLGETVTLGHNAHSREGFARGAIRAAKWLVGKEPGLYTMADVLGLK